MQPLAMITHDIRAHTWLLATFQLNISQLVIP